MVDVTGPAEVVVALGSKWMDLESKSTRWREVLVAWAQDPRVGSVTTLDYPRFGALPSVREGSSWLDAVRSLEVTVMGRRQVGPDTAPGWWVTGRAVRKALGPRTGPRVVVASTPLWTPVLKHLAPDRTGFDGVDDWRAYDGAAGARDRVERGYRVLPRLDAVTAVSDVLAGRLAGDFGATVTVVSNGVDTHRFRNAPPSVDSRLPRGPFAIYVGSVEARVDLDLLSSLAVRVPVVVAGPATEGAARVLKAGHMTWLGPVHTDDVPGLLARARVGLLPHHRTSLTESMDPMKLLEYLAAGLPVVSTSLPNLGATPGVWVTDGQGDFVSTTERLLESHAERLELAKGSRAWAAVADQLLSGLLGASAC